MPFPSTRGARPAFFCLAVDDTLDALARLARFHRDRHPARVVAITGSNGKTTTRALTAGVLSRRYPVVATRGNFNNAVGLPLSLFALTPAHRWAVFEIGMNRPGEIDRLAWICRPDLGVITNIGPAHLEGLGTLDAVRDAKGELLERLGPSGVAVLNADDPRVMQLASRTTRSILFGTSTAAAVRAEKIVTETDGLRFDLVLPEKTRLGAPADGRPLHGVQRPGRSGGGLACRPGHRGDRCRPGGLPSGARPAWCAWKPNAASR